MAEGEDGKAGGGVKDIIIEICHDIDGRHGLHCAFELDIENKSHKGCDLLRHEGYDGENHSCAKNLMMPDTGTSDIYPKPGPDCPGPGKYRLVKEG